MASNGSQNGPGAAGLEQIISAARAAGGRGLPPVHLWNPPHCGDIGLRIAKDGTWFYQNSPIGRLPLVKLFASILRHDPEGHVLVTPVEKVSVEVEDAPFLAVEWAENDRHLAFRTNLDDWTSVHAASDLRFQPSASGGLKPYVRVRANLWALATRPVFYDLVARGQTRDVEGKPMFGVASGDAFCPMAPADEIEGLT